jgi:hypothetical protein
MGRRDAWGVSALRDRCAALRDAVLRDDLATAPELDSVAPGGEENPYPAGRGAWLHYFAQLIRFTERLTTRETLAEKDLEAARKEAYAGLREQPVQVELIHPDPAGNAQSLAVYPKSFDALCLVDEIDIGIRFILSQADRLEASGSAEHTLRAQEARRAASELHQVVCWIACTKGPSVPFDSTEPHPPAPGPYRDLDPFDILLILQAFHRVNRTRFEAVGRLMGRTPQADDAADPSRASWETLGLAVAEHQRCPIEHLLRDRSLVAWVSQSALTWDQRARAAEEAERQNTAQSGSAPAFAGIGGER